jgi:hypothetical protein
MIIVLYVDLRKNKSVMKKSVVEWQDDLKANSAIAQGLGEVLARIIEDDLKINNPEITVSWNSLVSDYHSDVGGVGDLDWIIEDQSALAIAYEDENTTDEQLDKSSDWMLENYQSS